MLTPKDIQSYFMVKDFIEKNGMEEIDSFIDGKTTPLIVETEGDGTDKVLLFNICV